MALDSGRGASQVYLIRTADQTGGAELAGSVELPGEAYSCLLPMETADRTLLLAYGREEGSLHAFQALGSPPYLKRLPTDARIEPGFDFVETFVMGNQHHLMCYSSRDGALQFYGLSDGLSPSKPYRYSRDREPGVTQGFTTLKALTTLGQLGILGYNTDDGHVAIFRVSVRTTSPPGVPPLSLTPVWSHHWARGWTRFAFFQFGGENFFLKTNVLKPNVIIDHILDDLTGSATVGSHLDLRAAQQLHIVRPLDLPDLGPHFVTYETNGETTVNRIRGDCQGWATMASFRSRENARHVVPLVAEGRPMLVVA